MPILTNNRRERFCQGIAKGLSATEAYRQAGYKGNGHSAEQGAHQLMRNSEVQVRIGELQRNAAIKAEISLESLTKRLLEIDKAATADGQHAAATGALALVARLHGFLVDHKTVDIIHHKPARQPTKAIELTEDEWLRLYARESPTRQAIAAPGGNANGRNS
jgi:hypothetical protein